VKASTEKILRRGILALLYSTSLAAIGIWLAKGWSFYRLDEHLRPRHADYARLTSGGSWGHWFGIVGSILIGLLLLYVVRKRWRAMDRTGSLRLWLDIHIWMGITGPLLIVLHSAFKVGGLVSISFWSMSAVALSGVLGRYLYLQIPRDERGEELDSQGMDRARSQLLGEAGVAWQDLPSAIQVHLAKPGGSPLHWLLEDLSWPLRKGNWRRLLLAHGQEPARVLKALRGLELLERRRGTLALASRLLHYWHVFHRPFALIMVLFLLVHIVVAQLFQSNHGLPQ
jgi:hypothetical protein